MAGEVVKMLHCVGKHRRITTTQLIPRAGSIAAPQPPATKFLLQRHLIQKELYKRGAEGISGENEAISRCGCGLRCRLLVGGETLPSPDAD